VSPPAEPYALSSAVPHGSSSHRSHLRNENEICRHDEQIQSQPMPFGLIAEECLPSLGPAGPGRLANYLANTSLADFDPRLSQLSMDSAGVPTA